MYEFAGQNPGVARGGEVQFQVSSCARWHAATTSTIVYTVVHVDDSRGGVRARAIGRVGAPAEILHLQ